MSDNKAIEFIKSATGAETVVSGVAVQELWSGYGSIRRFHITGVAETTVILKSVMPPINPSHPRGWNTSFSNQRKLRSYEIESTWYEQYSADCDDECRVPRYLGSASLDTGRYLLLEDLDLGFPHRRGSLSVEEAAVCLRWLAGFHARFLQRDAKGLWPVGTYWHLDTRPDEYRDMEDGPVKRHAVEIDQLLKNCRYQTLVHGDAKVANFCFAENLNSVAAVDFQYVGRGCGMKDVVYLLGSCLSESACERHEAELLDVYFGNLEASLSSKLSSSDFTALNNEWREMFDVAWTDFYRFLLGWMPAHSKVNDYTRRLGSRVIKKLEGHY